jgi:hypothetical protein
MRGRKNQGISRGDVFLVPLEDGTHSLGQVLDVTKHVMNSVLCAVFTLRGMRPRVDAFLPEEKAMVAVQFVTPDSLKRHLWPIIRNDEVLIDPGRYLALVELASKKWIGAKIIGSGNMNNLMDAYFGLRPWDDQHDPNYLDKLLAPGVPRPSNAVLVKPVDR